MKARIAYGLAALLLSCTVAPAQPAPDPAKVALAREIYDLSHAKFDPGRFYNPPGAKDAETTARVAELRAQMKARYDKIAPVTREATAQAYAARFTMDELNALKRFYQTPVATKLTALQPEIAVEVSKAVMPQIMGEMKLSPYDRKQTP
jgi:hypothetical protein